MRRRHSIMALHCALIATLSGCALSTLHGVMRPTLTGKILVETADAGTLEWRPDRCDSGDLQYFRGFDFSSTTNAHTLRVLIDPVTGPMLRWAADGHVSSRATQLQSGDCPLFDVVVNPTGWRVNEVREFAGYLRVQCTAADGTRFTGSLQVDHCH